MLEPAMLLDKGDRPAIKFSPLHGSQEGVP